MEVEHKNTDSSLSSAKLDGQKILSSPPKAGSHGLRTRHQDRGSCLPLHVHLTFIPAPSQEIELRQLFNLIFSKVEICVCILITHQSPRQRSWDTVFEVLNTRPWCVIKLGQNWSETCTTVGRAGYQQMNAEDKRLCWLAAPCPLPLFLWLFLQLSNCFSQRTSILLAPSAAR